MSKSSFRFIDTLMLTLIAIFLDLLTIGLLSFFSGVEFAISISQAIVLIILFRWGGIAGLTAVILGITTCIFSNNITIEQIVIYSLGNLFILFNLLWFIKDYKQRLLKSRMQISLYVVTGYLLLAFGRGLISSIVDMNFLNIFRFSIQHLATILLDMVVSIIVVQIAVSYKIVVDMNQYLKEMKELEGNENDRAGKN